jgi:predicted kinase
MSKIVVAMSGHTSAGKTTLAKYLQNKFNIEYISEGNIKRQFVGNYDTRDSLSEALRDKGYEKAIECTIDVIKGKDSVILDASFHKQFRRTLLNNALGDKFSNCILVWLYCNCSNYDEIVKRIMNRKTAIKNADNQADDISIELFENFSF